MFVVQQEHGLTDLNIPQRNTAGNSGFIVNNLAQDALPGQCLVILAEQVAELIDIKGRNLKAHYALLAIYERNYIRSISQIWPHSDL
jgi:hypothetical protein